MNIQSVSLNSFIDFFIKYKNHFMAVVVAVGLMIGAAVYFRMSRLKLEASAQQALSESLDDFNKAFDNPELWYDVEISAKTGYKQFSSSSLAPYFLVLQAEALMQQGKIQDSLAIMDSMLKSLVTNSPLYYLFKIKYARMKLDSNDANQEASGLQDLIALSNDKKNNQQDEARYYLGLHYMNHDDLEKAHMVWQELVKAEQDSETISPWALMAEQALQQG